MRWETTEKRAALTEHVQIGVTPGQVKEMLGQMLEQLSERMLPNVVRKDEWVSDRQHLVRNDRLEVQQQKFVRKNEWESVRDPLQRDLAQVIEEVQKWNEQGPDYGDYGSQDEHSSRDVRE